MSSTNGKTFRVSLGGGDLLFLVMFIWLAFDRHPAWWLAVVATVATWLIPTKWRRVTIFKWRAKK